MAMLIAGILLWSLVHFIPSVTPHLKARWLDLCGSKGYWATFSIIVLLSLVMIVFGWRHTMPSSVYMPLPALKHFAMLLMVIAIILFGAAKHQTRIKRLVRHPQLASVVVWGIAHLMLNGDIRSVILFSSMTMWALLEIYFINRREGEWVKPQAPSWLQELKGLLISAVILIVVVLLHTYIAGVAIH